MSKLSNSLVEEIEETIRSKSKDLTQIRRHFHAHPELSHQEFETTQDVADKLDEVGFEVHVRDEGVGLYADLVPDQFDPSEDPTVAIRSDMDALPIHEQNDVPYASENEGVMHACGHDVHMASVLGAGMAAEKLRGELPGRLRLIFQHAEEAVPGGAPEMVAFGAVDEVDAILGLHCKPELETGKIGVREGAFTAGFHKFEITIKGKGGHGARPHRCIDPIYVVTKLANALYEASDRSFDARDPVVISIGEMHGGDAPNSIPDQAYITGTVRTLSEEHQSKVEPLLKRIVGGVCMTHDAEYDLDLEFGAPSIYNDPRIVEHVAEVGEELLGAESVAEIPLPSMGSEDFSIYTQHAPGTMFRLGTAGVGPQYQLHSNKFSVDERAISIGAYILARSGVRLLDDIAGQARSAQERAEAARESNEQRKQQTVDETMDEVPEAESTPSYEEQDSLTEG
jgi:amidohydrolase